MDGADELIRGNDVEEMKTTVRKTSKNTSKFTELISQPKEFQIDNGISLRTVHRWKKEMKAKYSTLLLQKDKLVDFLDSRERETHKEDEGQKWEQKLQVELKIIEKRMQLELEETACTVHQRSPP